MREFLIILLVIAVLFGLTAFRYRKQLFAFYRFWSALRQIQGNNKEAQINEPAADGNGQLVNCSKCGTWTPESTSIRLGMRTYYCSAACMEKAASAG